MLIKNIGPEKLVVKRLSDTRWSARADAVKALSFGCTEIQDALEELLKDLQQTPDTRHQAKSLFDHMLFRETAIMTRL